MTKTLPHNWISVALFCVSLLINCSIAATNPIGYADSDEIATASYLFTTAHPPGYSQQIVLTGIFQHVLGLFRITPAHASNLFAALLHSATLTLLYLAAHHLYNPKKRIVLVSVSGAIGTLVLGFNALFWLYSGVIEVMSLGNFYVSLMLYYLSRWLKDPKKNTALVSRIAFIFGLSVAHLQSTIIFGPVLFYFLAAHQTQSVDRWVKQMSRIVLVSFAAFAIANSVLFWLNGRRQEVAWDFPQNLSGLIYMVSRGDYQGNFANKGIVVSNAYVNISGLLNVKAIPIYVVALWNHMGGLPVIFCIIGGIWLLKKNQKIAFGYLGMYIIAGLLFGMYVTISNPPSALNSLQLVGISQRQYLIGYTVLGLFSSLGCMYLSEWITRLAKNQTIRYTVFTTLVCLPILAESIANLEMANQKNNSLISTFSRSLLQSVEPNAVIICSSDIACFNLFYQSIIEHIRPDVTVLSKIHRSRKYFLENNPQFIGKQGLQLPQFYSQQLSWNAARRPTYLIMPEEYFIKYTGLNGNPYFLVPKGYMFKVETATPSALVDHPTDDIYRLVMDAKASNRDFLGLAVKDYFASLYVIKGKQYYMLHDRANAIKNVDYAQSLNNWSPVIRQWQQGLIQN